jgi:hypothetical protein
LAVVGLKNSASRSLSPLGQEKITDILARTPVNFKIQKFLEIQVKKLRERGFCHIFLGTEDQT